MALIKCPECNKEISDKADACVHCGCPTERTARAIEKSKSNKLSVKFLVIGLIIVVLAILFIIGLWNNGLGILDYGLKEWFT